MKQLITLLLLATAMSAFAGGKQKFYEKGSFNGCWKKDAEGKKPEGCGWLSPIGTTREEFFKYTMQGVNFSHINSSTLTTQNREVEQIVMRDSFGKLFYVYVENGKVTTTQD